MFEPCLCAALDCPSCGPLQGVAQRTHSALGSLDAEDLDILDDGPDGTRVVPLYSESGTYREWEVTLADTQYCIVDEDGDWTLMYYVPDIAAWRDAPDDIDEFLATHKLILAA